MSAANAQVSATISTTTKEKLDRFTEELGLKKNFVVEQALLYFMESRRELPDEAFIPARIVVEDDELEQIVKRLEASPAPTSMLRELMRDKNG
jgi:antitoxin component of RelBE/YafQ-DinJ toxin-antitoxin module